MSVDIHKYRQYATMTQTQEEKLLKYIKRRGIVRPNEVTSKGWARSYLQRLKSKGLIKAIGRGLYTAQDAYVTEQRGIAEVCKRVPNAVVCLLSALRFHNITTQLPFEVWVALSVKARKPALDYPPMHVVRFSGKALSQGIDSHVVEGVNVRVYNVPKTVADCFKYRNKIGLDVAIEALRECRQKQLATIDELWHYASLCRVTKVMQPYLQAIV
jgi:predicted transcriptional regulator of viral defense system